MKWKSERFSSLAGCWGSDGAGELHRVIRHIELCEFLELGDLEKMVAVQTELCSLPAKYRLKKLEYGLLFHDGKVHI